MEDDMAVDTALWLIIGAGVAWIWLGCFMTASQGKTAEIRRDRARH